MWELEAQNAARERGREAAERKTLEGSRGKTQDANKASRKACLCYCCIKSEKARERCTCVCLQGKCGVAMSEVSCASHIKSTTHAVKSDREEDSVMAEESDRDIGDKEKRRGVQTSHTEGDTKPGRGHGLEPSLNVGIWGWWAQTNRKVHYVERINGRGHWVVKRGDCSKGQKSKVKDGKDNMG